MTRCMSRWTTAAVVWVAFTSTAGAETLAATVEQWGLLGSWAVDCAVRPDRDKGALLTYEIQKDGRVMYRRNFGEAMAQDRRRLEDAIAAALVGIFVHAPTHPGNVHFERYTPAGPANRAS